MFPFLKPPRLGRDDFGKGYFLLQRAKFMVRSSEKYGIQIDNPLCLAYNDARHHIPPCKKSYSATTRATNCLNEALLCKTCVPRWRRRTKQ